MMLFTRGDLFTTADKVIAHGCNNQGVMGAGVAKIVRDRYPHVYTVYRETLGSRVRRHQTFPDLGWNSYAEAGDRVIVNMITQVLGNMPRPVSYDAIDECFEHMFIWMQATGRDSVSIPKIGAGLGGGNWSVIEAIIRGQMARAPNITVTVWEL